MKLLFVSSLYPNSLKKTFADYCRGGVSLLNQADAFQWAVVEGLAENNVDFEIVSFPALGTYPIHLKKIYVPSSKIVYEGKCYGRSLKYSSLIIYKEWDIKWRLEKYVERWINKFISSDETLIVLIYTSAVMFVEPIVKLRFKYDRLKICCIITDLIDDAMNFESNRTFLKRIQILHEKRKQKIMYKYIDFYTLLSKAMEEKIPEAIGRNIVIEGIYSKYEKVISRNILTSNRYKIILYGGTLEQFSGVSDLVDAFMLLGEQNYRLVICGSGICENYISRCKKIDSRIIFKGVISRSDFLLLQKEATLLVNPRKPTEDITRFSFPSKTIEYLSSGVPMLGYKLEGIPSEYYDFFYTVDDLTIQGLANKLQYVLTLPDEERAIMAKNAQNFIFQHKTGKCQIKKMLDFFHSNSLN